MKKYLLLTLVSLIMLQSCSNDTSTPITPISNGAQQEKVMEVDFFAAIGNALKSAWNWTKKAAVAVWNVAKADASGAVFGAGVVTAYSKYIGPVDPTTAGWVVGGCAAVYSIEEALSLATPGTSGSGNGINMSPSPYNSATNTDDLSGYYHNYLVHHVLNNPDDFEGTNGDIDYGKIYDYYLTFGIAQGINTQTAGAILDRNTFIGVNTRYDNSSRPLLEKEVSVADLQDESKDLLNEFSLKIENSVTMDDIQATAEEYYNKIDILTVPAAEKTSLKRIMAVSKYSVAFWKQFTESTVAP